MTGTPDTRHFAEHPLPGAQWPAFVGKRPDADPLVRWALVGNDRIGADRLGQLLTDAEPVIAAGARVRFLSGLAD